MHKWYRNTWLWSYLYSIAEKNRDSNSDFHDGGFHDEDFHDEDCLKTVIDICYWIITVTTILILSCLMVMSSRYIR